MRALFDKLFLHQASNIWVELLRYLFVGGSAFVVDYGLLYLLVEFASVHYLAAAAIAFVAGLTVNYLLSIKWVFSSNANSFSRRAEFTIFAVIGVVGLGLNEAIIWTLTDKAGCYVMISKLVSTAVVFGWNFGARKFILFRNTK